MALHYFDYAASTPPLPEALTTFEQVSRECYANPSSMHELGREAKRKLQDLKDEFVRLCGDRQSRLILTSGGTEANNLVIKGIMEKHPRGRLLLAADVHASAWFAKDHYRGRVDIVPLDGSGRISPQRIQRAIKRNTVLFSAVHACNETGVIHDIAAYGDICRENGIPLHCDGCQALGHTAVDLSAVPLGYYTFSAQKFGGVRGTGGIVTHHSELTPQIMGGSQEGELRAGTENVAGLAAALGALERCRDMLSAETTRLRRLAELLLRRLDEQGTAFMTNSCPDGLPGLVSLSFPENAATHVIAEMSLRGFALSAGSACHADDIEPSRIILARGRSKVEALGTVRISMGRGTDEEAVTALAETLAQVVTRQKVLA